MDLSRGLGDVYKRQVLGQSGVTNNLEGGKTYMGFPATEASAKRRELVWIKRIPELWKKVMD
jgi:UDP-3-O-[3-hydroxymyristoyl] glucosamine N-acyltransferase